MKKTVWDKRIPTLLGLVLVIFATFFTSILVRQGTNLLGIAAPSNVPQNVRISNITSSGFTISYITDALSSGSINYGKDENFGSLALDERGLTLRKTHSIKVLNLSSSTKYFFSIVSGEESFLNNGLSYEVTTGPNIIAKKPKGGFIVGKVVLPSGAPLSDGVLYVTTGNSQVLSTVIKSDGSYSLSLEGTRTKDLASFFDFKDSRVNMLIVGSEGISNITLGYKEVNSVPTIVISLDYDFTEKEEVATVSAVLENFPDFPKTKSKNINPKITTPSDSQSLQDDRPLFRGTGVPGSTIKITIESEKQEAEVTVDSNGNWTFRPSQNLSPGEHKITISAKDAFGVLRTITHTFVILVSEDSQAQAATPSASPSPSPTPVPTLTPSPSPVSFPTPTPLIGGAPTLSPSPVPTELPEVGTLNIANAMLSMVKTLVGGMLFLISRGAISF